MKRPWLSLHNHLSERDIREYVNKRKISGAVPAASKDGGVEIPLRG
ncbi:MAG: hypothetical protein ABFS45_09120 [Pseudomonadota bacterium]